ncbi:orotidine-5'-phosphate decarboxylase [Patescibacteria group bacterium]|nr:orotidine-5'-phosphate decarboxylase [Patescibacteria group bacterium]
MINLTPQQRLVIAADFKPDEESGRAGVRQKVLRLAGQLKGTGFVLKMNSALRACGYELLDEVHSRGLATFVDLKLIDIPETMETDGAFLRESKPEFLTTMAFSYFEGMRRLKGMLPETKVLGVTVLTSFTDKDLEGLFNVALRVPDTVLRLARLSQVAGLDGVICSPAEAVMVRAQMGEDFLIFTPGVRFDDVQVVGDDQNPERVMTPWRAIKCGANGIVMGRPIVQASNPRLAAERAYAEILEACRAS